LVNIGLDQILDEFEVDSKDQRPRAYTKVLDWPKVDFEPSDTFKENFLKLPEQLVKGVWETVPGSEMIPLNLKKLTIKLASVLPAKILETVSQACMSGATVIVNFFIEILKGNLSNEQSMNFFVFNAKYSNDDTSSFTCSSSTMLATPKSKKLVLNETRSFKLLYEAHYRDEPVNLLQEEVKITFL
jgi:hypothetical protein